MSDGDFFREVDEAVRHERYRLIWDRYGYHIIGLAALIVLAVAGYKGWIYWQDQRAQTVGASFVDALKLSESGQGSKAQAAFEKLAKDGTPGYRALARFQLAAAEADAGKTKQAVAGYDAIAGDGSVDPILQGDAMIQAAALRLPDATYAEMQRRLKGLIDQNSPWKYSAYDLLGLSAYRLKDLDTAQQQFSMLMTDAGTPSNLREQATVMLALIMGSPQKSDKTAADSKTE